MLSGFGGKVENNKRKKTKKTQQKHKASNYYHIDSLINFL